MCMLSGETWGQAECACSNVFTGAHGVTAHPCNPPTAGAAFAASHGGRLFKLEDVALASWLEWAAQQGNFRIHRVTDRR